jgi:NAD-dependent dihydropyrimidine dehydrogenase PreA subunit
VTASWRETPTRSQAGAAINPLPGAHATSIYTGQQSDIGTLAAVGREAERQKRALARIAHNDGAKVALALLMRQAADDCYEAHPADAVALDEMAKRLDACRGGSAFREASCGAYLVRPHSCHGRLCPDCERARSTRLVSRFAELADKMGQPRFWTLTVPNVPPGDLELGIDVLLDALAHLRRRAIFEGGPCRADHRASAFEDVDTGVRHSFGREIGPCSHPRHSRELAAAGTCRCARCIEVEIVSDGYRVSVNGCPRCTHAPVAGGVYSLEVTWNPDRGDWHPHAHLLVDAPWIRWGEMRDAWRAVTCDAIRRAQMRRAGLVGRIPACPHHADEKGLATDGCAGASVVWVEDVRGAPGSEARLAAIRETLKYVSKGLLDNEGRPLPGVGPREIAELLLATRGRRLVSGWGSFRHVHDREDDKLDPVEYLVGPDVLPSMQGLPRRCPLCGGEALWEPPISVRRTSCRPGRGGVLVWRPPGRWHDEDRRWGR